MQNKATSPISNTIARDNTSHRPRKRARSVWPQKKGAFCMATEKGRTLYRIWSLVYEDMPRYQLSQQRSPQLAFLLRDTQLIHTSSVAFWRIHSSSDSCSPAAGPYMALFVWFTMASSFDPFETATDVTNTLENIAPQSTPADCPFNSYIGNCNFISFIVNGARVLTSCFQFHRSVLSQKRIRTFVAAFTARLQFVVSKMAGQIQSRHVLHNSISITQNLSALP